MIFPSDPSSKFFTFIRRRAARPHLNRPLKFLQFQSFWYVMTILFLIMRNRLDWRDACQFAAFRARLCAYLGVAHNPSCRLYLLCAKSHWKLAVSSDAYMREMKYSRDFFWNPLINFLLLINQISTQVQTDDAKQNVAQKTRFKPRSPADTAWSFISQMRRPLCQNSVGHYSPTEKHHQLWNGGRRNQQITNRKLSRAIDWWLYYCSVRSQLPKWKCEKQLESGRESQ